MSTTSTLIVAIVCLLGLLLSFAVFRHGLIQKREQRRRLISALQTRNRQLHSLVDGLPEGYLPADLRLLLLDRRIDVLEQLVGLQPNSLRYQEQMQALRDSKKADYSQRRVRLSQPQQIKTAKESLGELHKMLVRLREKGTVDELQFRRHHSQIKGMMTQIAVDSYCVGAAHARQDGKLKLAIQTYESAVALLKREAGEGDYSGLIRGIGSLIREIQQELAEREQAGSAEIDQQNQPEHLWKKNRVYD